MSDQRAGADGRYTCETCGEAFDTPHAYSGHQNVHSGLIRAEAARDRLTDQCVDGREWCSGPRDIDPDRATLGCCLACWTAAGKAGFPGAPDCDGKTPSAPTEAEHSERP